MGRLYFLCRTPVWGTSRLVTAPQLPLVQTFDFVSIPLSADKKNKTPEAAKQRLHEFYGTQRVRVQVRNPPSSKRGRSRGCANAQLLRVAALRTPPSSSISPFPLALMKTNASLLLFGNGAFWLVGSEAAVFLKLSLDVWYPHLTSRFSFFDLIGRSYEL